MADKNQTTPLTEAVYYILLSVINPLHGYGIIQNVKELSGGRQSAGKGLDRAAGEDERKKEYIITDSGKTALEKELNRLEELVKNGRDILRG